MTKRRCGDCTACCTALQVKELDLAEGQSCQHQKRHGGCAIYEERPQACRGFECAWLRGNLAVKDRPDRIGVIFTPNIDGTIMQAFELRPGAAQKGRGKMWIDLLRKKLPVIIARGENSDRTYLGRTA